MRRDKSISMKEMVVLGLEGASKYGKTFKNFWKIISSIAMENDI